MAVPNGNDGPIHITPESLAGDSFRALHASCMDAKEMVDRMRDLLQRWEARVNCPQCGHRYAKRSCGPTHDSVRALVYPDPEMIET